ncbi:uncharacterized protein EDB93DRAFT_1106369 [Suillus bovinus]|uniref:uncharacterized protein n=1 Tax=Suillus bovinus TaxID=48563 RepID=UPI001B870CB2|nr:uncharacterized protein EDB93DRAFT_1106369 [Suillus bovinus]KAG2138405.1 hypothetical protein EDB93DRAFT_1106369 [Suillus bovinus]
MPNQWKSTSPLDIIQPHILHLWKARQTDKQIVVELQKHFDTLHYGLSMLRLTKFLKIRKGMGLRRTHQQMHNVETIREVMTDLCMTYPNAGAREMSLFVLQECGDILLRHIQARTCPPAQGQSPSKEMILGSGNMPMVTQSDPGSENFGIANAHTMLRQWHDPALQGTLQHHWMQNKKNIMPKITWSQMRRRFTPGFKSLLDHGVMSGWYDSNNTLQILWDRFRMVFQWVFIPWLQRELDAYQDQSPEDFGALDFKITVEREALDHIQNLYIDPSHIIFDLVSQSFRKLIQHYYEELGRPSVTRQSAWDVYLLFLDMLQGNKEIPSTIEDVEEDLPLLENYQDLPYHKDNNGAYYMGGVGGGLGLSSIDEDIIRLDHDGLVIWEFSNFSNVSDGDTDVDECSLDTCALTGNLGVIGPTKALPIYGTAS